MDGLGQPKLEDKGLKAAFQEILELQGKHVIEFALKKECVRITTKKEMVVWKIVSRSNQLRNGNLGLIQNTEAQQTTDDGLAFKQSLLVGGFESEQLTRVNDEKKETNTSI